MSKFTIYTSLAFLLICGAAAYTYYYYVLDIEYHSFEIESNDDFLLRIEAPTKVKKNQRFSVYAELKYIGNESITFERRWPEVDISVYNDKNDEINAFSPYSGMGFTEFKEETLKPNVTFYLNLEYKIEEEGVYTISANRGAFVREEKRLSGFELPIELQVGNK